MSRPEIKDPIERIIAEALDEAGIPFEHVNNVPPLDFYLPGWDCFIECKQFHSDRVADQLKYHPDIILIQGGKAAVCFAQMLSQTTHTRRP